MKEYIEKLESALVDVLSGWTMLNFCDLTDISWERSAEILKFMDEVRENYETRHGLRNEPRNVEAVVIRGQSIAKQKIG